MGYGFAGILRSLVRSIVVKTEPKSEYGRKGILHDAFFFPPNCVQGPSRREKKPKRVEIVTVVILKGATNSHI